ncbi:MAG: tyrosine-type recombinase/integrase [Candidatus Bipolaricaulia bacterium]
MQKWSSKGQFQGTVPLSEIKAFTIRSYLAHLQDRGLKNTTIAIYLRALKAFFNWLAREGLIAMAKNPVWWTGFRNYTMLLTFLDVGLRRNELINLEVGDLSRAQRSLKVHGKGAKDRVCFMGAKLTKTMRRWIDLRGYQPYSEEVFVTRTGEWLCPSRHGCLIYLFKYFLR